MKDNYYGEMVRRLRQTHPMTQSQLAKKAKVAQSTVAQIESGRKMPSLKVLNRIVRVLGYEVLIA